MADMRSLNLGWHKALRTTLALSTYLGCGLVQAHGMEQEGQNIFGSTFPDGRTSRVIIAMFRYGGIGPA